ncbi:MAG: Rossmann-fold NAD(P)-binding domain-containing protein, partial [Hyphococcus sp.]
MSEGRLFCFGYGYTAAALAGRLGDKGWSVAGTTTSADKAARMTEANVCAHVWRPHGFHAEWLEGANAVLVSTPPDDTGCPSLAAAQEALAAYKQDLRWIGYLSTNGVYGDYDGAWVDEESALRATSARSIRRIQAETGWRRFADEQDLPLVIFRLPGIYGPGR